MNIKVEEQKTLRLLIIVVAIILLVGVIGLLGWDFYQSNQISNCLNHGISVTDCRSAFSGGTP